jgi:hypothetical protein
MMRDDEVRMIVKEFEKINSKYNAWMNIVGVKNIKGYTDFIPDEKGKVHEYYKGVTVMSYRYRGTYNNYKDIEKCVCFMHMSLQDFFINGTKEWEVVKITGALGDFNGMMLAEEQPMILIINPKNRDFYIDWRGTITKR